MKRLLAILALAALVPVATMAAETGRYRVVSLLQGGSSGDQASLNPKVFILDTAEGHMWTWSENELIVDEAGSQRYGTIVVYQGRVRPGKRIGEVVGKDVR